MLVVSKRGNPSRLLSAAPQLHAPVSQAQKKSPQINCLPFSVTAAYKTGLTVMWKLTLRWQLPQFLACLGVATEMVLPVAISVIVTCRRLTNRFLWCGSTGSHTKYWNCWLTLGLIYCSPKCQGMNTWPPPCSDSLLDSPCRNTAGLTSRETLVRGALFLLWKSPHVLQTQEGKILILQNYDSDPRLVYREGPFISYTDNI